MDEENVSVEKQEVAETAESSVKTQEVAETVQSNVEAEQQVQEETNTVNDAAFAKLRRKMEESEKEAAKIMSEKQRLTDALKLYGFDGENTDDILDKVNANFYGKTVEEIRQQRLQEETKVKNEEQIKQELEYYHTREIEAQMASDLSAIQKINPNIKGFQDLGEPYFDLIRKGIDGVRAYKLLELDGLIESKNIAIEQQAIKKLRANSNSSVGSLDSPETRNKTVADMSDKEFDILLEKAKRGELKRE